MSNDESTRPIRKLLRGKMKRAEYMRNVHHVIADVGTTEQEMMNPNYWAHVASEFKPYDHVEVLFEDGSAVYDLIVKSCDRLWAKMVIRNKTVLAGTAEDGVNQSPEGVDDFNAQYEVKWGGPSLKHCVVQTFGEKERVKTGFQSKEEAHKYLNEYVKTLAA